MMIGPLDHAECIGWPQLRLCSCCASLPVAPAVLFLRDRAVQGAGQLPEGRQHQLLAGLLRGHGRHGRPRLRQPAPAVSQSHKSHQVKSGYDAHAFAAPAILHLLTAASSVLRLHAVLSPCCSMALQYQPGAEHVLCIAVDNNPLDGQYFVDPGLQDASVLSSPAYTPAYSYATPGRVSAAAAAASAPAFYDVGAAIPAATVADLAGSVAVANPLRSFGSGVFSLPSVGVGGSGSGSEACAAPGSAGGAVGFMAGAPLRSCVQALPAGLDAASCASMGAAVWTTALRLGSTPQAAVSGASPAWVPVALGSVFQLMASNASLLRLGSGAGAAAVAGGGVFSASGSSCTCAGVLIGVAYRVSIYQTASSITSAEADAVIADITAPIEQCGLGVGGGGLPLPVPFSAAVTFIPDAASVAALSPPASLANDNLLPVERSGWPGYEAGSPILAGVMTTASGVPVSSAAATDQKAVARSVPAAPGDSFAAAAANVTGVGTGRMGLHLRGAAADGSCAALPTIPAGTGGAIAILPADPAQAVAVTYTDNAVAGCTLQLTAAQFAALCSGSPSSLIPYTGLGSVDPTGTGLLAAFGSRLLPTHIGTIGGADPLKSWHWLPLSAPATAPPAAAYDATTGTCTGVVTGIDVALLTAPTGQVGHPQERIVAARWSYATDTWKWGRETGGGAAGSTASQPFTLRSTVTWVSMAASIQDFTPPAPPVVPPLPADLFYPFVSSTSAQENGLTTSAAMPAAAAAHPLSLAAAVAAAAWLLAAVGGGR